MLYVTAEVIRQVAILAQPFMPSVGGEAARSSGRAGGGAAVRELGGGRRIAVRRGAAGAEPGVSALRESEGSAQS